VPLSAEEDRFSVRFAGDGRVKGTAEFDLVLTDHDGVQSTRTVVVQAVEDQPPQVEVAVEVLRKVGNAYLCTPVARVPLVKESIVRDDTGLSRVEFQFAVTRVEAQVVVGLQVQAIAGIWASAPVVPGLGSAFGPVASAALAGQLGKGDQKQSAALPAAPFERAYEALPKDTAAGLAARLARPPANPDAPAVVRDVKFTLDGDGFDLSEADRVLEARGRRMRAADPTDVSPGSGSTWRWWPPT
jgi:hypothetical protein